MSADSYTKLPSSQQAGQPAPFLRKTYELVDDPSSNNVISWGPTGKSFIVWKPAEFARDLLPQYFKHNNFQSFIRQLNTYGFRKTDPDRWEFANPCFQQQNRDLLLTIHRRKPATGGPAAGAAECGGAPSDTGSVAPASVPVAAPPAQAPAPPPAAAPALAPQPVPPAPVVAAPGAIPQSHPQPAAFTLQAPFPLDLGIAASLPLFTAMPNAASAFGAAASPHPAAAVPMAIPVPHLAMAGAGTPAAVGLVAHIPLATSPGSAFMRAGSATGLPPATLLIKQETGPQLAAGPGPIPGAPPSFPGQLGSLPAVAPLEPGPSAGFGRLEQLMEDYLKPGQQVLAALMHPAALPANGPGSGSATGSAPVGEQNTSSSGGDLQGAGQAPLPVDSSRSQSENSAPSASSEQDGPAIDSELPDANKSLKRSRDERGYRYSMTATATAAAPGALPGSASPHGNGYSGAADGMTSAGMATAFDAAGNPLPAGITRPVPQSVGPTAAQLLSEMAGQLGRLSALAKEVEGLKEENTALKRSMEVLTQSYTTHLRLGTPSDASAMDATATMAEAAAAAAAAASAAGPSSSGPVDLAIEQQNKHLWDQKLRSDTLELELQKQQEVAAQQAMRTAALEAAVAASSAKSLHDAQQLERSFEVRVSAQGEHLQDRLAQQERVHKATLDNNHRLEARIAELESQLKGTDTQPSALTNAQPPDPAPAEPPPSAVALDGRSATAPAGEAKQGDGVRSATVVATGVARSPSALRLAHQHAAGDSRRLESQEVLAKSIEDRLWNTVTSLVVSAANPASGARLVLEAAKARQDAYSQQATNTSSSTGGGSAALAVDGTGPTHSSSDASDSNSADLPGALGCAQRYDKGSGLSADHARDTPEADAAAAAGGGGGEAGGRPGLQVHASAKGARDSGGSGLGGQGSSSPVLEGGGGGAAGAQPGNGAVQSVQRRPAEQSGTVASAASGADDMDMS